MKDLVVLIPSCDAYSDAWDPFFHFFFKFWPNCPYDIYLGTNKNHYDHPRVNVIRVGKDRSWAESTKAMLQAIESKYVLIFLEDYFIFECDIPGIEDAFRRVKKLQAKYLMLTPTPKPDRRLPDNDAIGEIKKGARHRTAVGLGFWEVKTFIALIEDGETAWEMESNGSARARDLDGFYRMWHSPVKFHNAIVTGIWRRHALKYCRENDVNVDTSKRPVFTGSETVWIGIKSFVRRSISKLPEPIFNKLFLLGRATLNFTRILSK